MSEAHHALELEKISYDDWLCVGHEDAARNLGDFFACGVADEKLFPA